MVAMKMINISFPLSSPKLTMDMQEQEEDSSNFYSMKVTIESNFMSYGATLDIKLIRIKFLSVVTLHEETK